MRRLLLVVDPTRSISADANQVHQHLDSVLGEGDSARLVVVVKIDRNLLDLEVVPSGDEQTFQVESETAERLPGENRLGGVGGEAFEPCLGVENSRKKDPLSEPVEQAAHEMPGVEIVEKGRTHHIA